jgi:hypothetical protein
VGERRRPNPPGGAEGHPRRRGLQRQASALRRALAELHVLRVGPSTSSRARKRQW